MQELWDLGSLFPSDFIMLPPVILQLLLLRLMLEIVWIEAIYVFNILRE